MKHGLIPTPPRLLYSQLAYRDETVCVGGGTDEVGGPPPVCVCDSKSKSVSLEGKRRGTFGSVIREKQTSHCTLSSQLAY